MCISADLLSLSAISSLSSSFISSSTIRAAEILRFRHTDTPAILNTSNFYKVVSMQAISKFRAKASLRMRGSPCFELLDCKVL